MAIDVKWFQDRIRDLGTSQRSISAVLAGNPNTVSLILTGRRRVTSAEVPQLAQLLDTTSEEILKRLGVEAPAQQKANAIECIGSVDETGRITNGATRSVDAPANATINTRAIVFNGMDSGHPQHGWLYFFEMAAKDRPVDADTLNALCFVEIGDAKGMHLGVVRRGLERGKFDLTNAFTGERIVGGIAIRSASRVTWIKAA